MKEGGRGQRWTEETRGRHRSRESARTSESKGAEGSGYGVRAACAGGAPGRGAGWRLPTWPVVEHFAAGRGRGGQALQCCHFGGSKALAAELGVDQLAMSGSGGGSRGHARPAAHQRPAAERPPCALPLCCVAPVFLRLPPGVSVPSRQWTFPRPSGRPLGSACHFPPGGAR